MSNVARREDLRLSSQRVSYLLGDYSNTIKVGIIGVAMLVIFLPDLYITATQAYASEYYNYVLLIPFLSGYLIYRKRRMLAAVLSLRDRNYPLNLTAGIGGLASCVVLYLYGSVTSSPEDWHLIALQLFLGSTVLLLFNRRTLRILLLPILLISSALPSVIELSLSYWSQAAQASAQPAYLFMKLLGYQINYTGTPWPTTTIVAANGAAYQFSVGIASSGIYSLVGASLFFAFLGYIAKGPLWKKVTLFLLAYPLLIVVNIVRMIILLNVAYWWGLAAFEIFHATSGIVLIFILMLALLVIGERVFKLNIIPARTILGICSMCKEQFKNRNNFCSNCGRYLGNAVGKFTSRDFVSIFVIVLIVLVFMSSLVPQINIADAPTRVPLNSVVSEAPNNSTVASAFLPPQSELPGWKFSFTEIDGYLMSALSADAVLIYSYSPLDPPSTPNSNISINTVVQITSEVHTPITSIFTHCITTGILCSNEDYLSDVTVLSSPPIVGQFLVCEGGQCGNAGKLAVLWWQELAWFNVGSSYAIRNIQIYFTVGTTTLAQAHVIKNPDDYLGALNYLMTLARASAEYWAPQGGNSILTAGVSRWSGAAVVLAFIPAIFVAGKDRIGFESLTKRRNSSKAIKSRNAAFAASLPPDIKNLLDQLAITPGGSANTGSNLLTIEELMKSYKAATGVDLSFPDVLKAMTYAEHMGLAKRVIVDKYDQPLMMWSILGAK